MSKKRQRVPGTRHLDLPAGVVAADAAALLSFYGNVSGTLRSDDFPTEPQAFFVQAQHVTVEGSSPWSTEAVYSSRAEAERAVSRWDRTRGTWGTRSLETGEFQPRDDQPVSIRRIATLEELFREGPQAFGQAFFSLITSDHEWIVSTEIGSEQKIQLMVDLGTL